MINIPFLKDKTYLDGACTQPMTTRVLETLDDLNKNYVINPSFEYNPDGYRVLEDALYTIANFLMCAPDELVFGKSTTELINNVAKQFDALVPPTAHIVISDEEHNANWLPWKEELTKHFLEHRLVILPYDEIPEYCSNNKVGIVSVAHTTNVMGETRDLDKICDSVDPETILIVDGCQHAPHVNKINIPPRVNMYMFSGHKVHGPKGVAVAYMDYDLNNKLAPFLYGGGNIAYHHNGGVVYNDSEFKHRAGTQDWNSVIALSVALSEKEHMDFESYKMKRKVLESLLEDLPVTIYNPKLDSSTLIFNFDTVDAYTALTGLIEDDYGYVSNNIYVRSGEMCNILTMRKLNIAGCIRVSISPYTTYDDILKFVDVTTNIIKKYGGSYEV